MTEPTWQALFTGKYLASADLGDREPTVKIERIEVETVEDEKKGPRERWIMYVANGRKGILLNRTNCVLIAAILNTDKPKEWIGHQVTFGVRDVPFGAEIVKGLRVVGSPELTEPKAVTIKLPKKKPQVVTLQPTGKGEKR